MTAEGQDKKIEEASKNKDNKVVKLENAEEKTDITVVVDNKPQPKKEETKKDETTKVDVKKETVKEVVSTKPEETKTETKVEDKDFEDMTDSDLTDLLDTKKEETTIGTPIVKEEVKLPKFPEVEEKVETKAPVADKEVTFTVKELPEEKEVTKVEAKEEVEKTTDVKTEVKAPVVEEEVKAPAKVEEKKVADVKVTALDGNTASVNSTIQFKIDGDDVKIDGLDGIDFTFVNGILTVNTGDEMTTLTVEASNSVNTVNFDIEIVGILG